MDRVQGTGNKQKHFDRLFVWSFLLTPVLSWTLDRDEGLNASEPKQQSSKSIRKPLCNNTEFSHQNFLYAQTSWSKIEKERERGRERGERGKQCPTEISSKQSQQLTNNGFAKPRHIHMDTRHAHARTHAHTQLRTNLAYRSMVGRENTSSSTPPPDPQRDGPHGIDRDVRLEVDWVADAF